MIQLNSIGVTTAAPSASTVSPAGDEVIVTVVVAGAVTLSETWMVSGLLDAPPDVTATVPV